MMLFEPRWKAYIIETNEPIFTKEQCEHIIRVGQSMEQKKAEVGIDTVDKEGKTVNEESKEIVECDDGVSHFLQDAGIAKNCKYYNWTGMEGWTPVEYRSLACEKLDGGYEIIPNYTGID